MEATDPLSTLLNHARSTLERITEGGPLENLHLTPRHELDRVKQDIAALERAVADLEARIEVLEQSP